MEGMIYRLKINAVLLVAIICAFIICVAVTTEDYESPEPEPTEIQSSQSDSIGNVE